MALDHEALWQKSKVLIDHALKARDHLQDDDYQLWASLVLEILGKARLAKMHPALVVDPQHAESLLAVCGGPPAAELKSIGAYTVFKRCHKTVPGFDQACEEFCKRLADDRNAHLHSGAIPFAARKPDSWQSKYWAVVEMLVVAQEKTLDELVGPDEAAAARIIIADARKTREMHVRRRIASHSDDFKALPGEEQRLKAAAAKLLDTQLNQDADTERKSLPCPACGNPGAINGTVVAETEAEIVEDDPWQRWFECTIASESFRCGACGLRLDASDEVEFSGLPTEYEKALVREDEGEPYGND